MNRRLFWNAATGSRLHSVSANGAAKAPSFTAARRDVPAATRPRNAPPP